MTSLFKPGDLVKVKAGIDPPTYGWAAVLPGDVGTVLHLSTNEVSINFPNHPGWNALIHEIELVNTPREVQLTTFDD